MHRDNNFDLLRLVFALIVVFAHCHDLSLQPSLWWIPRLFSSRVAVEGFFAMSGYLIVASYDCTSSLSSFMVKRARRILPAYWAALAFSLTLGTLLSTLSTRAFWQSHETWKYIFADLTFANFLHPSLPGLFSNNPDQSSVDAALWTIKIEVMFYLLVPSFVHICRRFGNWQVLSSIFWLSILYRVICDHFQRTALAIQLPGQLCYFAVGGIVYYYSSWFHRHGIWMWVAGCAAYLTYLATGGLALRALGVSLIVLCLALLFPRIQGPAKYGDFSYGIYVFHCPVIQSLILLGLFDAHPDLAVSLVLTLVIILAIASWNLIEKPSLYGKNNRPVHKKLMTASLKSQ